MAGIILTLIAFARQYNVDRTDLSSVRQWQFDTLEPNVANQLMQGIIISNDKARQSEFYSSAFIEPGIASKETDREAVIRFKKFMADNQMIPADSNENKNPYYRNETFLLDRTQINDLEKGDSTLYGMVYVKWRTMQGLIREYYSYDSMAVPPKNGYVAGISWHRLMQ